MKRIVQALFMALLAALILSGCKASTAPETPDAARRLSCVQPSSLTGLCPAGGAKVAMCRTDESGETTAVELDYDLRFLDIAAFDASGSRMLAHFYLSPYSSKCGSAIFDPDCRHWTYYSGGNEGVYFVDSYSRTFASEDRARIMEFFMTRDDDAQELIKSPAIKKKLQHMSSAVRSVFDTSGWESVRWERLL